jgi:hypothetical protein
VKLKINEGTAVQGVHLLPEDLSKTHNSKNPIHLWQANPVIIKVEVQFHHEPFSSFAIEFIENQREMPL